jgi:hypothetical protein
VPTPIAIQPRKQTSADCAIVALEMFLGIPYAQVAAFVAATSPKAFIRGMWTTEIQRVAAGLGTKLKRQRKWADDDSGILVLQLEDACHAVVLFEGVIINPGDGMVWNYDAYLAKACAQPLHLLVEA